MRKLSIAFGLFLLVPAVGRAETLEDLLANRGVITKDSHMGAGGAAKVYWNNGTRVDFPDNGFNTTISTFMQNRYQFTDNDNGVKNTSSFEIHKARVTIAGNALNQEFDYKLEYDLVSGDAADGSQAPALTDAYLTWHPCDEGWVKMGQFKTPLGHQFNADDRTLQFADRSSVSEFFNLGRQQGAMAGSSWGDVSLALGLFNGSSDGEGINRTGADTHHTLTASGRVNVMGQMDTKAEGDVDYTEDMAMDIGAAYAYADDQNDLGAGLTDNQNNSVSVDANVKSKGASLHAEFLYRELDPDEGDNSDQTGFYVQGGYFVQPKKMEVAVRYGYLDTDKSTDIDTQNELNIGLNYYWWAHHLKAQLGYTLLNTDSVDSDEDDNTSKWLLQLSSWF